MGIEKCPASRNYHFMPPSLGIEETTSAKWLSRYWTTGTSRHILFPLLGSNHKRHGTGQIPSGSPDEWPSDDPTKEPTAQGSSGQELGTPRRAETAWRCSEFTLHFLMLEWLWIIVIEITKGESMSCELYRSKSYRYIVVNLQKRALVDGLST